MLSPKIKLLRLAKQRRKMKATHYSRTVLPFQYELNLNLQQLKELSVLVKLEEVYPNKIRANLIWHSWGKAWKAYRKLASAQHQLSNLKNLTTKEKNRLTAAIELNGKRFQKNYSTVTLFLNWYGEKYLTKIAHLKVQLQPVTKLESGFWAVNVSATPS